MGKKYHDLKIWQKGIEITLDVYTFTRSYPEEEKFGLVSQMRRAAVSIPSNIAEGYGRYSQKEFSQFLRISKGSLCELDTQLIISRKLGFINEEIYLNVSKQIDSLLNMVVALINKCIKK